PESRFADAVEAHDACLRATASRPTPDEVMAELEGFRGDLRSQQQLASSYRCINDPLKENERAEIWRSERNGKQLLVKLWKQPAWGGDLRREGASIVSFLRQAAAIKADRPYGVPSVKDVVWLADSFALIQEWADGSTLAELITSKPDEFDSQISILELAAKLIGVVDGLHEQGYGHGDLKPDNIVITPQGSPLLIDALDFSPSVDGEIVSSVYA